MLKKLFRNGLIVLIALLVFMQAHISVSVPHGKSSPQIEFALVQEAEANTCVYNAAGNWSAAGTWTSCGGVAPTAADDVQVGSGTTTGTLTLDCAVASPCLAKSVDFTGFTGTFSPASGKELDVYGSFKLVSGMTSVWNASSHLTFKATTTGFQITTAGKSIGIVVFDGASGGWTLQDTFNSVANIVLTNGTFDTGSQTLTGPNFSLGVGTKTLNGGTSTWGFAGNAGTDWDANTNQTNFTCNCSTLILQGRHTTANVTIAGGGLTYGGYLNTVSTTGTTTLAQANTWATLDFEPAVASVQKGYLALSANQTFTGSCRIQGQSMLNRAIVRSDTRGTARSLSCGSIHASTASASFQDITAAGAANWDLHAITGGAGDMAGNTGITFTSPSTLYICNSGNSQSFSTTSLFRTADNCGGSSVVWCLPQDTVHIGTGWTGASKVLTMDANTQNACGIVVDSAPGADLTITFTGNIDYYTALTFNSHATLTGTGQIQLNGSGGTITTGGQTITPKIVETAPGATWTQGDNLTDNRNTTNCIDIQSGTYKNNAHTTNCTGAAGTIAVSGGTFLVSANLTSTAGVGVVSVTSTGALNADTGYQIDGLVLSTLSASADTGGSGTCMIGQKGNYHDIDEIMQEAM